MALLYLDYAASTPTSEIVYEAMKPWMIDHFANPSASHYEGELVKEMLEQSKEVIAEKIGAFASEIIFTSGATESNNLAIKGLAFNHLEDKGHIITSNIEHKSVIKTCEYLEHLGFEVTYISPTKSGLIDPTNIMKAIKKNTILISIHHLNNELGTIQNITEIGTIAFENNILFHVDAAQSFCKLLIDVNSMNIDFLSISAHKIYGPKGVGALYVRDARASNLVPLMHGGEQQFGLRSGTLASALIKGFAVAVKSFPKKSDELSDYVINTLANYKYTRNGSDQTSNIFSITFTTDEDEKAFLAENSWLISKGSACNTISNQSSHVLDAIGLSIDDARRTYRISTPPFSKV